MYSTCIGWARKSGTLLAFGFPPLLDALYLQFLFTREISIKCRCLSADVSESVSVQVSCNFVMMAGLTRAVPNSRFYYSAE